MPRKPEPDQPLARRAPRQERALQKLELIFEAATRLLEKKAPEDISTNAIAELAGISIGTLYQYFPDKGAIFQALMARELKGLSDRVLETVQAPATHPGSRVSAVIGAALDSYGGRKVAHRRLMHYSLERGTTGLLGPMMESLMASFTKDGVAGKGASIPALSKADAFVLTHAVGGVLRAAVGAQAAGGVDRKELEQSLTRLVLGFSKQS